MFLSDDGGVEKCASDLLKTVHSSILSLLPAAHPELEMKNNAVITCLSSRFFSVAVCEG